MTEDELIRTNVNDRRLKKSFCINILIYTPVTVSAVMWTDQDSQFVETHAV